MKARYRGNCGTKSCGPNRMAGPFDVFSADLGDILHGVFGEHQVGDFTPRANVSESETGYQVSIELPGLSTDDITVEVEENQLIVSGEKKIEKAEEANWTRSERATGKFRRVFEFSKLVDFEQISATSNNGVLTIDVPMSVKAMPRKVDIKSMN